MDKDGTQNVEEFKIIISEEEMQMEKRTKRGKHQTVGVGQKWYTRRGKNHMQ